MKQWKTSGIMKLDSVVCCASLAYSKIPCELVSLWMQRGVHGCLGSEQHLWGPVTSLQLSFGLSALQEINFVSEHRL